MANKNELKPVIKRFLIMILIIFIYVLGTRIPLPFAEVTARYKEVMDNTPMSLMSIMSGASFSQLSVFSIGLNPFMIVMLIIQLMLMTRFLGIDALSMDQIQILQQFLILILTIIQAAFLTFGLIKTGDLRENFCVILLLTAGSMLVIWLCFMNIKHGIGGTSPIILINILTGMIPSLGQIIKGMQKLTNPNMLIALMILLSLGIAYFWVAFSHAYYPLKTINTSLPSYSKPVIIPIGLNMGAMMTYMVGMAVLTIPAMLTLYFSPDSLINNIYVQTSASFVLAFLLFYFFTFMQFSPHEQAKNLRNSNNYILNVRPGKPTQRYLRKLLLSVTLPGALLTAAQLTLGLSGVKLFGVYAGLAVIPMNVVMICMFSLGIKDQVETMLYPHRYSRLMKEEK